MVQPIRGSLTALRAGSESNGANAEIIPLRPQLEVMVPRWQSLAMPVLIVQGDKDCLVHPGNALFMRQMQINSDVRDLHREGLGHSMLWEEAPVIRDNVIELFGSSSDPLAQLLGQLNAYRKCLTLLS